MDLKQILTRRKASEHPRGANCWSQLLPIGLTRLEFSNHTLWPLLGLQGHQKGLFWPKRSLYGAPEGLKGPLGARFDPNCRQLVRLGWNHGYHKIWAGIGPQFWSRGAQKRPFWAITGPFGVPGDPEKAQYQAKVFGNHDSNPVGPIGGSWDQIWPTGCSESFLPVRICLRQN